MYRSLRYETLKSFFYVITAPIFKVTFKAYLLAEILTDCNVQIDDFIKIGSYFQHDNWNHKIVKMSWNSLQISTPVKWCFYCISFLPYMWRMNQNLKKWLVYNHRLQAFNALKYFILIIASICGIIYYEFKIKVFSYLYYGIKAVGTAYKFYWDIHIDWGLFHKVKDEKTKEVRRVLRQKMKYPAWFYYISMVFNFIGLYSWAISLLLYKYYEKQSDREAFGNIGFFFSVMWITWFECLINAARRTMWIVIRVESEFYNNYEQFRDIVTIPPIKYED